jgi:hypothetical protein
LPSRGQQAGAATPQSAFVRHDSHLPLMQKGDPAPQSVSRTQSTQPIAASHFLPPQVLAVVASHAIPLPAPPLLPTPPLSELPHATTRMVVKAIASGTRVESTSMIR